MGCKVHIVTEEYTSQTCGCFGRTTKVEGNRLFVCGYDDCSFELDRDMNGARNVLIKKRTEEYYS